MFTERTSIGLDVHARSVAAAAIDSLTGQVVQGRLTPSYEHIRSWISSLPGPVAVAYEAGPTGFGLHRDLAAAGVRCEVVAPSKLQKPSGDRVKTDARDALHLARLLRLDEVTSVAIPSVDQEAARDLVRAREDCRGDLMRARHRLSKLLLRHGIVYYGGRAWTGAHDRWLRTEAAPQLILPATRMAFDADYDHVLTMQARRRRLDAAIEEMAAASEFTPIVRRMCCLRGVSTLTGFALAVEIGDWNRFTGNTIGSFVGLVPSEYSSGSSRVQGSITKTGNTHARRLLVEAAWHHRPRYHIGAVMRSRWEQAPAAARTRGDDGNRRLHQRWVGFLERSKRPVTANVAIARELAGWCWSLAVMDC
ncbi:possible transposase [Rhodococcus jostii RHA1]|uniref:Possible transposase n=1 Tax=Rhodococcus jostii (strain RHA1) TaxID=101510 RepID=Q0S177_RHOJR|nr:IS110 family transposase [Rhodococcus jostii]ABG92586.1 possible transposase [Rhodococcus jostii RHA1]ABG96020.1 possible transposase [Rhodococcus jostii RHA1]ABG98709.1 possible transposase [Rhodococcus jostii RHA1]